MRSRAVILPSACNFSIRFGPPPNLTWANRFFKSESKSLLWSSFLLKLMSIWVFVVYWVAKIQNPSEKLNFKMDLVLIFNECLFFGIVYHSF